MGSEAGVSLRSGSIHARFRALAVTIVPEAAALDDTGWAEVERIVEDALAQRPRAMQRQLLVFIRLLDALPLFRWGRTFRRLDHDRRTRFLGGLQRSRLFLFRRGFWGLRTLVYMGYYGRPQAYRAVGYQARLRGWLEHPDAPPSAREATLRQAGHAAGEGAVDQGPADQGRAGSARPGAP